MMREHPYVGSAHVWRVHSCVAGAHVWRVHLPG